jgi:ABC-2 type transport system ATP-binding protein
LTPEEYFYFIGDLRGQNKADALLATHEEFSTAKSKNKKIFTICQRNQKKWASSPLSGIQKLLF